MNQVEAHRLASAINQIRPDWPLASLSTWIRKHLTEKAYRDAAVALTWVAYPTVARRGAADFARRAGRGVSVLLPVGAVMAAVLALSAFPLLPLVYGHQFNGATWPAAWIALGLIAEPAAGLASAYLMGTGRPGTNSLILGVGLAVTVALDLLLIPTYGALGAAVASAVAYLTTDLVLLAAMRHGIRTREATA